jgi:hypothetical protein
MAKSPEELAATMVRNLKGKTGKDLPAWLRVVKASKLDKHGAIVKMLKSEHDVTHGFANLIAHEYLQSAAPAVAAGGTDLVEAQYAGDKASLRPIYDALEKAVGKFGKDVEFAPKKAYVSLRRNKQFALVQPSTRTRVDVGINLKDAPAAGRLEKSGSFNSMVSHRVRVESVKDVDKELIGWLKSAYDAS